MYETLKEYIESKRGTSPNKTIADYVLDNKVLTESEITFIDHFYQENKKEQPFKGMRILFNMHQDRATWLLMLCYQALGAQVEASNFNLSELPFAETVLQESDIPYYKNQLPNKTRNHYHHIVDCGAGALASFDPRYGMVELTQTLPHLYTNIRFPVLSANKTFAKRAEMKGTAKGGLAALPSAIVKQITDKVGRSSTALEIEDKMAVYTARFHANFYVIIGGGGKVGQGFARALLKNGIKKNHILLVDTKKTNTLNNLAGDELNNVPFLENEQGELVSLGNKQAFKQAILAHMQKIEPTKHYSYENFARNISLITATGVRHLLSDFNYSPADFSDHSWFINMGQPDEYGPNFPEEVMVGGKGALNFNPRWLAENGFATKPKYLMPCWLALAYGTLHIIQHKLKAGLWTTPAEIDENIMNLAAEIYGGEFVVMAEFMRDQLRKTNVSSPSRSQESASSKATTANSSVPTSPERPHGAAANMDKKRPAESEELSYVQKKVILSKRTDEQDDPSQRYALRRAHNTTTTQKY